MMSRALGIAIAILIFLHPHVSAQLPTCLPGYSSLFNSLGQSPCTMAEALGGACTDDGFTLNPLPPDFFYLGPTPTGATPCTCNTVFYSVVSACGLCQNHTYLDWSVYNANCTTIYIQNFPKPIPSSIRIPHYAYLDVVTDNTFNATAAESAGGPESTPGAASATSSSTPTAKAQAKSSKPNVGAIVGGVVGGVIFLGIVIGVAFVMMRRRKSRPTPSTYSSVTSPENVTGYMDGKDNFAKPGLMVSGRVYDPNDPTTFPVPTHDSVSYSTYSASPDFHQRGPLLTPIAPNRAQYTGAPEL